MAKAHAHSWEVADEFRARVATLVPQPVRDPNKQYLGAGAGRPPKAPLAQEAMGSNPTDRGKNGSKRHLLVVSRKRAVA